MLRTLLALVVALAAAPSLAGEWPAWRGPTGTGIADETGLPLEWSAEKNVTWRVPLPGPGNSTPIVWDDRVFVTQSLDEGARRTVMCFNRSDGTLHWQRAVEFTGEETTHQTNPFCAASPVTDGERVIAWHGSAGLVAYDFEGNELWRRDLGTFHHIWGNAASPVLVDGLVICNLGPGTEAALAAFDKRTGEDVWRVELPEAKSENPEQYKGSWSTPVIFETGSSRQLMLSLPQKLIAFDPATGDELWHCRGLSDLVYTSPLVGLETVVAMSGYTGPALAVRTGGAGDVTETHRLWLHEKNDQRVGSGVVVGDHLFIMDEPGIARCFVLATGELVWEERLGGTTWSSMAHADGRLYVAAADGTTYVLAAATEYKLLAENPLGEVTRGSLAFSDGQVFVRTYDALYCIGGRKEAAAARLEVIYPPKADADK